MPNLRPKSEIESHVPAAPIVKFAPVPVQFSDLPLEPDVQSRRPFHSAPGGLTRPISPAALRRLGRVSHPLEMIGTYRYLGRTYVRSLEAAPDQTVLIACCDGSRLLIGPDRLPPTSAQVERMIANKEIVRTIEGDETLRMTSPAAGGPNFPDQVETVWIRAPRSEGRRRPVVGESGPRQSPPAVGVLERPSGRSDAA